MVGAGQLTQGVRNSKGDGVGLFHRQNNQVLQI